MRRECPDIAVRAEVDVASHLLDRIQDGSLDVAVVYSPPPRPELVLELIAEEKLIMVTTAEDRRLRPETYIYVDWGSPFAASHETAFPELANAAVSISLGPLALNYLTTVGGAGYFRSAAVRPYLASGQLQPVEAAPEFSYSVYAVYSTRSEADLIDRVRSGLRLCAQR
jgi:DNA-binding transcriptional LysR family regulator